MLTANSDPAAVSQLESACKKELQLLAISLRNQSRYTWRLANTIVLWKPHAQSTQWYHAILLAWARLEPEIRMMYCTTACFGTLTDALARLTESFSPRMASTADPIRWGRPNLDRIWFCCWHDTEYSAVSTPRGYYIVECCRYTTVYIYNMYL